MPSGRSSSSDSCKVAFVGVVNRQFCELYPGGPACSVQFYDPEDQPGRVVPYVREGPGRVLPPFRTPPSGWLEERLRELEPDSIVPTSEFAVEPAHRVARRLGAEFLGNPPGVVRRAGDKWELYRRLSDLVPMPETSRDPGEVPGRVIVEKPVSGAGGVGVRRVERERAKPRSGVIFQRLLKGRHVSALFLSDGSDAVLLSVNDQLVDLDGDGYAYRGNLVPSPFHLVPRVRRQLERVCRVVTEELGLVGLNGVDGVLEGDTFYLVEVNPRPTAATECLARVADVNPMTVHASACRGELRLKRVRVRGWACKRVVYAPGTVRAGRLSRARDRVRPGTIVPGGEPVCTVVACSSTPSAALRLTEREERWVLRRLEPVSSTPPTEGWY